MLCYFSVENGPWHKGHIDSDPRQVGFSHSENKNGVPFNTTDIVLTHVEYTWGRYDIVRITGYESTGEGRYKLAGVRVVFNKRHIPKDEK